MTGFMTPFLVANLFLGGIIGFLFLCRLLLRPVLTGRMQYRLWYLLLLLLAVPFLPLRPAGPWQIVGWLQRRSMPARADSDFSGMQISAGMTEEFGPLKDFVLSVSRGMPGRAEMLLAGIWIAGMLAGTFFLFRSALRLHALTRAALPLPEGEILLVYRRCLQEMNIRKSIPVYTSSLIRSPALAGLIRPRIYLPVFPGRDHSARELRFIFLHELQHFRHGDAFSGILMNLAGILYWFNPLVRLALREMRTDREIACDLSVLDLLEEDEHVAYGNALLDFAGKISLPSSPFFAGIGGSLRQMRRRILNIASFRRPSVRRKRLSRLAFGGMAFLLLLPAPLLSTRAAEEEHYRWKISSEDISVMDLSAYFGACEGSFVLYDMEREKWVVHDMERAVLRASPDSTWKIYDALIGLEEGVITPGRSLLPWDGAQYPFEAWNKDQDLPSAMASSVNWYFQEIDRQLGPSVIRRYLGKLEYGNERIDINPASYWLESSLQISPVEQVRLLMGLYADGSGFSPENREAVLNAIRLFSSESGSFHGKTGTGRVDGKDVNGWFVGYVKKEGGTCFFATNIQAPQDASGSRAAEISLDILSALGIWES